MVLYCIFVTQITK